MSCANVAARACCVYLAIGCSLVAAPPRPAEHREGDTQPVNIEPADLLADETARTKLFADQLAAEVQAAMAAARENAKADPEATVQNLKELAARIAAAPEIAADVRTSLRGKLADALRAAQRIAAQREAADVADGQRRAAAAERQAVTTALDRQEQRLVQLTERLGSLLDERRYTLADEIVAPEIVAADPDAPLAATSASTSAIRAFAEADEARQARVRGVIATLHQVEVSHLPQPDDPSIVYKDAAWWQDLTQRRKRYAASDLSRPSRAEKKLFNALEQETTFDFHAMPLADALEVIKDAHGIEIQFDHKALEDAGISTDIVVTRQLKGISLRSALRLMLNDLGLSYLLKHEVLLITTPERAANEVVMRVYPVEDLVVPIRLPAFGGGFGPMTGMNQGDQNQQNPFNNLQNGQNNQNGLFQQPGPPF